MKLILLVILQYSILIFTLLKKPHWVDNNSEFEIVIWFPLIGPGAIVATLGIILMFATPFLLPLGIANGFIWLLNKFANTNLKYIG